MAKKDDVYIALIKFVKENYLVPPVMDQPNDNLSPIIQSLKQNV